MQRKIFISINLPDRVKKGLVRATDPWKDLPVKWTREENLHITLVFLGHVSDDLIPEICKKVQSASRKSEIFDMNFDRIEIAPSEKDPRMIWLLGGSNDNLRDLVNDIEKELAIFSGKKSFRPHVTLGKLRVHKWKELEEKPEIDIKFPLIVTAEGVDVMASEFEGGSKYSIIESCQLK